MTSSFTIGIIVTIAVIAVNFLILSIIPLGINKLVNFLSKKEGQSENSSNLKANT